VKVQRTQLQPKSDGCFLNNQSSLDGEVSRVSVIRVKKKGVQQIIFGLQTTRCLMTFIGAAARHTVD
jgi:hypothetical protein